MKLSIVIVNYNVKYFLMQCLDSVFKSIENLDAEVFVVDNNSVDGSIEMIKQDFPEVILIENKENLGFSKANNQAIRVSKGKYVLLLNPDTVVAEDTFEKVVNFMDSQEDAGGLGVRMVDGNGNFLPESKRGLPTPEVAFYKIFGFSSLFPKSKKFGKYHLGHLGEFEVNKIDILSGAFMLLRKETLDKVGLLDENFFMYGEDIDLSYRITLGGYENYYFPDSTIIHYKGESTKKSSVNYVFIFYKAMAIFAEKHFGRNKASFFNVLIKIAIFFRATLALFNRLIEILFLPIIDFSIIYFGIHLAKRYYQSETSIYHESTTAHLAILTLSITIILSFLYSGCYDKPIKQKSLLIGSIIATPLVFIAFLIFKNQLLISTPLALLTIFGAIGGVVLFRYLLHGLGIQKFKANLSRKKILIIGQGDELEKTENLISLTQSESKILNFNPKNRLDKFNSIGKLIHENSIEKPNEVIFCKNQTDYKKMIALMCENKKQSVEFKIAHPNHKFIIGSTNLNTSGELYTLQLKGVKSQKNKRLKRTLDVLAGFFLLLFMPVTIFFIKDKGAYIKNVWQVTIGKKTLIGYHKEGEYQSLPHLKPGILNFSDSIENLNQKKQIDLAKLNRIYAHDYSILMDLKILFKSFKKLDKKLN